MMELNPTYTPKPEDTVNRLFTELVENAGRVASELEKYKQVLPESEEALRTSYNRMRFLTSNVVGDMPPLPMCHSSMLVSVQGYITKLMDVGYCTIGRKKGHFTT